MVVFVVKVYAVREAKKWRYAVRKAKVGRYAVRKGGGGVTLIIQVNIQDIDVDRVHQSLDKLAKEYGPIVRIRLLRRKIVVLNSADVINKAFASEEYKALLNDKATGSVLAFGWISIVIFWSFYAVFYDKTENTKRLYIYICVPL